MKTHRIFFTAVLAMLLVFGGCSEDSSTTPVTDSDPTLDPPVINLFEASKDVAPSFKGSLAKSDWEWDWGNPLYELYNKFREFDPAIHNGVIDGSNFFRALYDMDEQLEHMLEVAEDIDPTVIQEPFEFGNSIEYDHAVNVVSSVIAGEEEKSGYAYRLDGDTIHFLIVYEFNEDSWIDEEGTQKTLGQLQGYYNPTSGDMQLAMVYLVDYETEYYVVRNEISGNSETHEFQMRMATSGTHGFGTTVTGKGVSQGEDAYFLVKMNLGDGMIGEGERYYAFASDTDEADLWAMDPDGLLFEELPTSVTTYAADVQSMVFFAEENLPVGLVDFNDSNITLDF